MGCFAVVSFSCLISVVGVQDEGASRAEPPSQSTSSSSKLTVVKWGWQSGSERRICYDCLQPWIEIQKQRTSGRATDASWSATILEYSERVSEVLGRQDDVRVPREVPATEEDVWVAFRRVVWELLEIFYVRQPPSLNAQIQDFLGWLQRNSQVIASLGAEDADAVPSSLDAMLRSVYERQFPETDESYWPCVRLLVFLGFNEAAIDLLGIHSAWQRWQNRDPAARAQFEILESLMTVLQKMPRLAGSSAGTALGAKVFENVSDYNLYKSKWSLACRQLLQNEALWRECCETSSETSEGAKALLSGLLGQESTLREDTRSWPELLCSQLLHRYPTVDSLSELSSLAEYCVGKSESGSEVISDILLAIFSDGVQEVISLCSRALGPWFMAHAPELILARPARRELREVLMPIRGRLGNQFEFFVLDFAEALMTNPGMWQTVCEYLAWCPTCGETALQTFLSHLPLADLDDGATLVALQIANMHGLPAVAAQMCRSLGLRCWALGQLERAAYWLRRGHDDGRLRLLGSEASGDREQERLSDLLQATKGGWEDRDGCWRSCEEVLAALEGSKMTEAKKQGARLDLARSMAESFLSKI